MHGGQFPIPTLESFRFCCSRDRAAVLSLLAILAVERVFVSLSDCSSAIRWWLFFTAVCTGTLLLTSFALSVACIHDEERVCAPPPLKSPFVAIQYNGFNRGWSSAPPVEPPSSRGVRISPARRELHVWQGWWCSSNRCTYARVGWMTTCREDALSSCLVSLLAANPMSRSTYIR